MPSPNNGRTINYLLIILVLILIIIPQPLGYSTTATTICYPIACVILWYLTVSNLVVFVKSPKKRGSVLIQAILAFLMAALLTICVFDLFL